MRDITADQIVDARNQMCPMPVMAVNKAIRGLQPAQVLKVLVTDRGALSDIPAWAEATGHELLGSGEEEGTLVFYIRKGEAA